MSSTSNFVFAMKWVSRYKLREQIRLGFLGNVIFS